MDYKTRLIDGFGQADTFYHMAISNMIIDGYLPSTGLNFTPYHPYHYLSHIIFAIVGKLTSVEIYQVYTYAVPLFLFPLFLQFLQVLIGKYTKSRGHFLLLPLILFGILPFGFGESTDSSYLISESQFLGIIAIFAFLYANPNGSRNKYNPFLIFVGFLSKISSGILFFVTDFLFIIFSKNAWKNKVVQVFLSSLFALFGVLLTVIINAGDQSDRIIVFNLFYQIRQAFPNLNIIQSLWILFYPFFLTIVAFLLVKKDSFSNKKSVFPIILIASSFLIGLLNTNITTGGWIWFAELPFWASMPFLLIFTIDILKGKSIIPFIKYPLFLIIIFLTCTNLYEKYKIYLSQYQSYFLNHFTITKEGEKFLPYFQALEEIKKFDLKKQYVVEIPLTEADFWEHSNNSPFYIPVISGNPAYMAYLRGSIPGLDPLLSSPEYPNHSFSQYWNNEEINLCKETKYKGIIRIWKDNQGQVVFKPFDCDGYGNIEKMIPKSTFQEFTITPKISGEIFVYNLGDWKNSGYLTENLPETTSLPQVNVIPGTIKYQLVILKENYGLKKIKPMDKVKALMDFGLKRIAETEKWKEKNQKIPDYEDKFRQAITILQDRVDLNNHFIKVGTTEEHYFQSLNQTLADLEKAEEIISDPIKKESLKKMNNEFRQWVTKIFSFWCPYKKFCYQENQVGYFTSEENISPTNYGGNYGEKPTPDSSWIEIKFGQPWNIKNFGTIVFEKSNVLQAILSPIETPFTPNLLLRKEDNLIFFKLVNPNQL